MSEQWQWTPGPWFCIETLVYALQDSFPAWYVEGKPQQVNRFDALVQGHFCPHDEKLANARLIAAAPDLAEAAVLQQAAEDAHAGCEHCRGASVLCLRCYPLFDEARVKLRAALAKARGER